MQPAFIAGFVLSFVGGHLLMNFGRDLYFGRASLNWRKADGRVVGRGTRTGTGQRVDDLAVAPAYSYTVNGVEYTSSRHDYTGRGSGAGSGLAAPSAGHRVTVWYDPLEPRRAVLVQGVEKGAYLRCLAATALLLSGVAFLIGSTPGTSDGPAVTRFSAARRHRPLSDAEIDSLQRLQISIDTFVAKRTHVELRVGDTLWMTSVYAEARDSTGRVLRGVGPVTTLPTTGVLQAVNRGFRAAAPGHTTLLLENRLHSQVDSIPQHPFTRIDILVRP